MIVGVNGRFLGARATGVQRFARSILERIAGHCEVVLFVPQGVQVPAHIAAHTSVRRGALRGVAWEQLELPTLAARHGDVLLNLANTAPIGVRRQVVMIHDLLPLTQPKWFAPAFSAWYGYMTPRLLERAAVILTSSQHVAGQIRARREGADVVVVPQGVEPFDRPAQAAVIAQTLARYGLLEPYVLALGAGQARKNIGFALAVTRECARMRNASLELVVAGAAPERVYGRSAQRTEEGVTYLGHVSDEELHALYTGAAAFLFPTLDEGFGRPPLEALCCGTPVLTSDYAAAAETLADLPVARLPLDVAAWAAALTRLLDSGERPAHSVGEQVAARWSWDAGADIVTAACARACERMAAPAGVA